MANYKNSNPAKKRQMSIQNVLEKKKAEIKAIEAASDIPSIVKDA